ncbi:PREDICTED: uncharacterized protein LOC106810123 [Priapulus caudatus]|uniref:Uncharacterized protein LOC106810123 n=1 Tax=Priapulus caudatus TaxID=37621 RepID=A0ABM1E9L2_PRICU|nr:PREDICTED: uncharacterized protein LOC106810123 [Priapulus caudatus]XP_014668884.1 PREDICTED: uncharacterized protein LOC106810123 [Priapulus caudatus]
MSMTGHAGKVAAKHAGKTVTEHGGKTSAGESREQVQAFMRGQGIRDGDWRGVLHRKHSADLRRGLDRLQVTLQKEQRQAERKTSQMALLTQQMALAFDDLAAASSSTCPSRKTSTDSQYSWPMGGASRRASVSRYGCCASMSPMPPGRCASWESALSSGTCVVRGADHRTSVIDVPTILVTSADDDDDGGAAVAATTDPARMDDEQLKIYNFMQLASSEGATGAAMEGRRDGGRQRRSSRVYAQPIPRLRRRSSVGGPAAAAIEEETEPPLRLPPLLLPPLHKQSKPLPVRTGFGPKPASSAAKQTMEVDWKELQQCRYLRQPRRRQEKTHVAHCNY